MHNDNGQAIAVDIGTSGIRGQLIDIVSEKVLRTCIFTRNPLPGLNVMDHLTFAMDLGVNIANDVLICAVNDMISRLGADDLRRISVCGNPIQLSIFEGIEIRDLAYAGKNKLSSENVTPAQRKGHIINGKKMGLPDVDVIIPPAIKHEIGADALAMMLRTGFLDDDVCMVTDYGTNAEMALKVGDNIYTGSAAAGSALEGQQLTSGMLAGPGALSDLVRTPSGWVMKVLDSELNEQDGPLLNLRSRMLKKQGVAPKGITGTGVIALIHAGMCDDIIHPPKIKDNEIVLGKNIVLREDDLKEAGKAIGAIRAGHMTLIKEAGIDPKDVSTMYMAGASGTYVDPVKAKNIGIIPPYVKRTIQVGNTSLGLARDLAVRPEMIDDLNDMVKRISAEHITFSSSSIFSSLYIMELAYWTEGMPLHRYSEQLSTMGLGGYLDARTSTEVEKRCTRDIQDVGASLEMCEPNVIFKASWECDMCMRCIQTCPVQALSFSDGDFVLNTGRCLGTPCYNCERFCPTGEFRQHQFKHR
ncbi:MAG: methylamine methyltransferase corrinoid protein reductive activase [Methanomassiliicoccaceae archaeon]|jgi:methylamine methyltransferase corrinoid protein reductive activase|nr:methylamine methyltransferase corrinoid protein reductive activase [Methanomassiliicoccaceae archaeon]